MSQVLDSEQIARLLFYPQMIEDGVLTPSAFPMDELLSKNGKDGSSVDRCGLLENRDQLLREKANELANPNSGRQPYGFCIGSTKKIRSLREELNKSQALEVIEDEITDSDSPRQWDRAHALIRKYDESYTRANLRGVRGYLSDVFSDIQKF